jgi:ribonuclease E
LEGAEALNPAEGTEPAATDAAPMPPAETPVTEGSTTESNAPANEDGETAEAREGNRRRRRPRRGERRDEETGEGVAETAASEDRSDVVAEAAAAAVAAPVAPVAPVEVPVDAVVTATPDVAPAPAPVAAAPAEPAGPYVLPVAELTQLAETVGLVWVNSDADKIRAAQEAIAAAPPPVHVPRERKPVVIVDEGPLVLVETRKDLSQITLPFDPPASAG